MPENRWRLSRICGLSTVLMGLLMAHRPSSVGNHDSGRVPVPAASRTTQTRPRLSIHRRPTGTMMCPSSRVPSARINCDAHRPAGGGPAKVGAISVPRVHPFLPGGATDAGGRRVAVGPPACQRRRGGRPITPRLTPCQRRSRRLTPCQRRSRRDTCSRHFSLGTG